MVEVLHRTYKTYSGCLVRGVRPFAAPADVELHLDRAVWLAAQLEGPKFGTVQSYDGCGISAGLLHNIAVLPKSLEQGSLFALLRRMIVSTANLPSVPLDALVHALAEVGWAVAHDGKLRTSSGVLVSGAAIRNEFAPPNGKVPNKTGADWAKAARWAAIFHEAFADPLTERGQIDYAIEWLAAGNRADELAVYRRFIPQPTLDSAVALRSRRLPPEVDFAMCVYHAFSVNAPAPAATALKSVATETDPRRFAKKLIRKLGTSTYGAWKDEPGDGGNRYDKTRLAAQRLGNLDLWPSGMMNELMPRDL